MDARYLTVPLVHWQIPAPHPSFLMYSRQNGAGRDEERDIRQPQNLQRIAGLRSFFTGVSDVPLLFIFVRYQQRGARLGRLHTSSPNSTYWFITNYLSRGPESVPCIIAGVTLDNGWWSYHPCTQSGNDICKKSSKQISLLSAGSGAVEVAARSTIIKSQ